MVSHPEPDILDYEVKWALGSTAVNKAAINKALQLTKLQLIKMRWASSLVQFNLPVMSDSLRPHGLQHTRLPCPSPIPGAYSNSCPSCRWCHLTISSSVALFSSCLQSFALSGSFQMSQFFTSGGQSVGASASVLPMNIQDWSPSGWTGLISLHSKGLLRVFSNTTVQASILQCSTFIVQLSHPYMTTGKTIALTRLRFVCNVSAF